MRTNICQGTAIFQMKMTSDDPLSLVSWKYWLMRLSCPAIPEDDSGLTALMSNDLPYIHKTPNKLKKKKSFKRTSSKGTLFCGNHTKHISRLVYICSLINYTIISRIQTMLTHEMAIKVASMHQSLSGGLSSPLGHDKRSRKKAWWGILALMIGTAHRPNGLLSIRTCALFPL